MEKEENSGALKELKLLIPKVISNSGSIVNGIVNDVKNNIGILNDDVSKEIERRRVICKECPYNSTNAIADGWYSSTRIDLHCALCSCNIEFKTASLESNCGAKWWNEKNEKVEKLPVRWEAYNKK